IGSGAYEKALNGGNAAIRIKSRACPLLVPLAEEGWIDNKISKEILEIYLEDFLHNGAEALILGCTHYPLFKPAIDSVFRENGRDIQIIDSGDAIAGMAVDLLAEKKLLNSSEGARLRCYVTDRPQRFGELAKRFLGEPVDDVEFVQLL
ncbi:MAG: glutamate racemase, partial [Balneolaceae bacterium]